MDTAQLSGYTELLVQATHNGDTKEFLILEKPSWTVLSSNIRSSFSISRSIAITYHDDDGDAITLDSDLELQELVAMLRAGGQAKLKVVVQTLGDVALYPEVPTVQEMEMELSPHSPSLIQPAPAPAPTVSNSDDWNMIPHVPADSAISAVPQSESSSGTHSTPENPFVAPVQVHAPPSESGSTKGKEKEQVVDVDVDIVEVVPSVTQIGELEPVTASNEGIVQDIMQMTADLQKAMDQFVESQNAPAAPGYDAGGPHHAPTPTTPTSVPAPSLAPAAAPQTLPPDLSQSFERVIGDLLEAVQLLRTSNSSEGGDERSRQERDRLKADLVRDVGVLVDQLRTTVTRSATLLASQMQIQVARVVAEIQARTAVYQAAAAAHDAQRAPGARAKDSDSDSSSDSSDSSCESDGETPNAGDQFDDWAYTGMTKEQLKAARKEWKQASKTWKKEAKKGARSAAKEGRNAEKGARKEARKAHKAARRAQKEARREARRRVLMQTRAIALATASFAGDSLRHAANQLSSSLHSMNVPAGAGVAAPPALPPNPTPAQTAEFAKYITVAIADQVRRAVETAAAYASTAYGSDAGATGHGPFAAGVPPAPFAPPPPPALAVPPAPASPAAPPSPPAPAAPAAPASLPTLVAPAAPAAPPAPPAPVAPPAPPVAPASHAVPAPVPHFPPWMAPPALSAPIVPPSVISAPPAPARDYGYEARHLREMGFPAGPNGEPLETMLARYEGNVDNVLAEILGA